MLKQLAKALSVRSLAGAALSFTVTVTLATSTGTTYREGLKVTV